MSWPHRPKLTVGSICVHGHEILSAADLYVYHRPGGVTLIICKTCQLTRGKTRRKRDADVQIALNGNVRRTAAEKELARVTRILDVMNAARVEHIARQGM